jgi:hypothetical protein
MEALGRLFDIGIGWVPVDLDTSNGATGKRIAMSGADAITFVVVTGVGGAEDLVLDLQQHTAYTSGTSADLDSVGVAGTTDLARFHIKAETALDNDEAWVKVDQTAGTTASECTVVGATYGTQQKLVVIEVNAAMMATGYTHLSLNAAITTSTAQLAACLYFLHELRYQRKPVNLRNLLNPPAANA